MNQFEYEILTNSYLGKKMHVTKPYLVYMAIFLSIVLILDFSIKTVGIALFICTLGVLGHLFKPLDKIYVDSKYLVIDKFGKSIIKINLTDILSYSSSTKLNLQLNSNKNFKISYSDWTMSKSKIDELKNVLDKSIAKSQSA